MVLEMRWRTPRAGTHSPSYQPRILWALTCKTSSIKWLGRSSPCLLLLFGTLSLHVVIRLHPSRDEVLGVDMDVMDVATAQYRLEAGTTDRRGPLRGL